MLALGRFESFKRLFGGLLLGVTAAGADTQRMILEHLDVTLDGKDLRVRLALDRHDLVTGQRRLARLQEFLQAQRYFEITPNTALHQAYVASQLAAYEIAHNRPDAALARLTPHLETAAQHENAALLSTLMLLRAEALELEGQVTEGRAVRLDSLGWARYGFGADWAVRAKLREVAALNPLKGGLGQL